MDCVTCGVFEHLEVYIAGCCISMFWYWAFKLIFGGYDVLLDKLAVRIKNFTHNHRKSNNKHNK